MKNLTENEIKEKIKEIKIPLYISLPTKIWFVFGKYFIVGLFVIMLILGIIYNSTFNIPQTDKIWGTMMLLFFISLGYGLTMLVTHIFKERFVKEEANKLNIDLDTWNKYVEELGIKIFAPK